MSDRQILQRSMNSLGEKGAARTIQSLISVLDDFMFDRRTGVNTREKIKPADLYQNDDDRQHNHWYQGTRLRHSEFLMHELNLPKDRVFVDVGPGKDKVLLMASGYNFERVIGIDLSHKLSRIAQSIISTSRQRH